VKADQAYHTTADILSSLAIKSRPWGVRRWEWPGSGRRKNVGKASGLASSARAIVSTEAK